MRDDNVKDKRREHLHPCLPPELLGHFTLCFLRKGNSCLRNGLSSPKHLILPPTKHAHSNTFTRLIFWRAVFLFPWEMAELGLLT